MIVVPGTYREMEETWVFGLQYRKELSTSWEYIPGIVTMEENIIVPCVEPLYILHVFDHSLTYLISTEISTLKWNTNIGLKKR